MWRFVKKLAAVKSNKMRSKQQETKEAVSEETLLQKDVVTPDEVLRLTKVTKRKFKVFV